MGSLVATHLMKKMIMMMVSMMMPMMMMMMMMMMMLTSAPPRNLVVGFSSFISRVLGVPACEAAARLSTIRLV